jgi:hypothetical protein
MQESEDCEDAAVVVRAPAQAAAAARFTLQVQTP